jgi:hypothetical protein
MVGDHQRDADDKDIRPHGEFVEKFRLLSEHNSLSEQSVPVEKRQHRSSYWIPRN